CVRSWSRPEPAARCSARCTRSSCTTAPLCWTPRAWRRRRPPTTSSPRHGWPRPRRARARTPPGLTRPRPSTWRTPARSSATASRRWGAGWPDARASRRRARSREGRPRSRRRHRRELDADDLQPARQRGEREFVHLIGGVAEDLVAVPELHPRRDEHAGGHGKQLDELVLHPGRDGRVPALLLEVPGAVGDVAVLVARDVAEALGEAGQDPVLLAVVRDVELAGQGERARDDHVERRHEVN